MIQKDLLKFRLATEEEIPAIMDLYHRLIEFVKGTNVISWRKGVHPTEEFVRSAYANKELYVLDQNGKILTVVALNHDQDPHFVEAQWHYQEQSPEEIIVVHVLAVEPEIKGQGLGRYTMELSTQYALEHGAKAMRLDTRESNYVSRSLYESMGYILCGMVELIKNDEPVNIVMYEKVL